MGNRKSHESSELKESELKLLEAKTHLTLAEILEIHSKFLVN